MAKRRVTTYPPDKNPGLPRSGKVEIEGRKCPCALCGHKSMEDCEKANCQCCTSVCT